MFLFSAIHRKLARLPILLGLLLTVFTLTVVYFTADMEGNILQFSRFKVSNFEADSISDSLRVDPNEKFTVIFLTYNRREILIDSIKNLSEMDSIDKIIVHANDNSVDIASLKEASRSTPIELYYHPEKNSLNNRFSSFGVDTDCALTLDDDVILNEDDLNYGFSVWQKHRDQIVGFIARDYSFDEKTSSYKYVTDFEEYSMVLTGAAFIHKKYFDFYQERSNQKSLELVDRVMNCEDIAMNFFVSHLTKLPPIKVTEILHVPCAKCNSSLWKKPNHFKIRDICINKLYQIYGEMPLIRNDKIF